MTGPRCESDTCNAHGPLNRERHRLEAERDQARAIAVALEQELARVTELIDNRITWANRGHWLFTGARRQGYRSAVQELREVIERERRA